MKRNRFVVPLVLKYSSNLLLPMKRADIGDNLTRSLDSHLVNARYQKHFCCWSCVPISKQQISATPYDTAFSTASYWPITCLRGACSVWSRNLLRIFHYYRLGLNIKGGSRLEYPPLSTRWSSHRSSWNKPDCKNDVNIQCSMES